MAAPFDAKKAIDELLQSLDNRVCAKVFAELHEKVMENKKRDDDFLRRQKNRYMKFLEDQRNSCEDDASAWADTLIQGVQLLVKQHLQSPIQSNNLTPPDQMVVSQTLVQSSISAPDSSIMSAAPQSFIISEPLTDQLPIVQSTTVSSSSCYLNIPKSLTNLFPSFSSPQSPAPQLQTVLEDFILSELANYQKSMKLRKAKATHHLTKTDSEVLSHHNHYLASDEYELLEIFRKWKNFEDNERQLKLIQAQRLEEIKNMEQEATELVTCGPELQSPPSAKKRKPSGEL